MTTPQQLVSKLWNYCNVLRDDAPIIKNGKGIRKLTPRECFLLRGFPKNFKLPENLVDSKLYYQAGNSVVVPVIQRIAENMRIVLEGGLINPQKSLS